MKKNQELGRSMVEMIAVIVLMLLLLLCGLWGFKKASLSARMGTINKDISSAIVERRYLNAQGGSRKPHRLIEKVGSTNLQIENLMDGDQFSVLLTNQSKEVCEKLKKYAVFTPEKIEVNHIEDGGCLENENEIELYFDNSSKGSTDLNINPTEKEECVLVFQRKLNRNGCCEEDRKSAQKCAKDITTTCVNTCSLRCLSDGTCGCSSDMDCTDPNTPKCNPATHQCVACLEREKVYPKTLNANGCCVNDTTNGKKCPSEITATCTSTCTMCLTDGICGCSSDADCTDPNTPKCEPTTHQCVACSGDTPIWNGTECTEALPEGTCTDNTNCKDGEYCNYYDYSNFNLRSGNYTNGPDTNSGVCLTTDTDSGTNDYGFTLSTQFMDWFSAKNFCESLNKTMVSLEDFHIISRSICSKGSCTFDEGYSWDNLKTGNLSNTNWWTKDTDSSNYHTPLAINTDSNYLTIYPYNEAYALCK